jgi:phosphopantetheine--protein transferase-like protein
LICFHNRPAIQVCSDNIMNWSPGEAWDVLRAKVASGATCVIAVPVPGSAEPSPAVTARLKDHELDHAARLRVPADRHLYIVAHYLLARSVQTIVDYRTLSWSFEPNTNDGKPRLIVENQTLYASLSHTRGAVAVAVSRVADVGVDVEAITHMDELDRVAEHVLSDRERHAVVDSAQPVRMFTRLWTRKEAITKAFGVGLRVPLNRIDVLDLAMLILPLELAGAVALSDVRCSGPCQLSVALRMPEIDPVSFEIPFDLLAEEAARASVAGGRS